MSWDGQSTGEDTRDHRQVLGTGVALDRAELEGAAFERCLEGGRSGLEPSGADVLRVTWARRADCDGLIPLHASRLGREVPVPVDETLLSLLQLPGPKTALNQLGLEAAHTARLLELLWPRADCGHRAHDYTWLRHPDHREPATISSMSGGRTVRVLGAHGSAADVVRRLVALLEQGGWCAPDAPDRPDLIGRPSSVEVVRINDDVLHTLGGSWREPPVADRAFASDPALDLLRRRAELAIADGAGGMVHSIFEDPRTCLTLPFWRRFVSVTHVVACIPDPLVAERHLRETHGLSADETGGLWLAYTRALLRNTRKDQRLLLLDEDLTRGGRAPLRRLAGFLGCPEYGESQAFRRAAEMCLRNELDASRESIRDVAADARLPLACRCLYLALRALGSADLETGGAPALGQDPLDQLAELTASAEDEVRRLRLALGGAEEDRLRALSDLDEVERERGALQSELRDRATAELDLILERERLREDLARASTDLAAITLSRSYPLLLSIWGLHHRLAPPGSRRWRWIERTLRNRAR
jgi:hypothetical protein